MSKRKKNILIIILLLLVNLIGFVVANNYFTQSDCSNCHTSKSIFSDWLGTKASIKETAKWVQSLTELMQIIKGV